VLWWLELLLGDLLNGWNDIGIGRAPAEVAAHALADLIVIERDMLSIQVGTYHTWPASLGFAQHADRRADLSRRAVATLKGVVRDERSLEWVQVLTVGKLLDRDGLGVLMGNGEAEAARDPPTIKQDGTGAALPVVAALLGAGKPETLAQCI